MRRGSLSGSCASAGHAARKRRARAATCPESVPPDQRAPELRLPAARLAALPAEHELGAIHRVLIEGVRDALGERHALPRALVARQVRRQRAGVRARAQRRQERRDRPRQRLARERVDRGLAPFHRAQQLLDDRAREREARVRPHAQVLRQLHAEPALHALALHHDHLGLERRPDGSAHDVREGGGELLHTVAAVDVHARHLDTSTRSPDQARPGQTRSAHGDLPVPLQGLRSVVGRGTGRGTPAQRALASLPRAHERARGRRGAQAPAAWSAPAVCRTDWKYLRIVAKRTTISDRYRRPAGYRAAPAARITDHHRGPYRRSRAAPASRITDHGSRPRIVPPITRGTGIPNHGSRPRTAPRARAAGARSTTRSGAARAQSSICEPISTTRSDGMLKNAVARWALRLMNANTDSRQGDMPSRPSASSVSRPMKKVVCSRL